MFYSLQGEGAQQGRPAIFLRFSGCNLWNGQESSRESAICQFCDTDFVGTNGPNGGEFADELSLVEQLLQLWPHQSSSELNRKNRTQSDKKFETKPFVVCTGGEPLLQLTDKLIEMFHKYECIVAIETNGTLPPLRGIAWICVSPKANAPLRLREGDELKLIFPQLNLQPSDLADLNFKHFYLQPMDGPHRDRNTTLALQYCLKNPQWKLSLQTHKILNIK